MKPSILGHFAAVVLLASAVVLVPSSLNSTATAVESVPLSGIVIPGSTGHLDDDLSFDTSWKCRASDTLVSVQLFGSGLATTNSLVAPIAYNQTNAPADSIGGFHLEVPTNLADLFAANGLDAPTGDYVFAVMCGTDPDQLDLWGGKRLRFTTDQTGTTYEQIEPVQPSVTVTPDFESPALYDPMHGSRFTVALDPSDAQGVVDFRLDGGFIPGNIFTPAPVQEHTFTLAPGTHSVIADFSETVPYAYWSASSQPSTVVVAGPATIKGTPRFGSSVTCSSVSGATRTYSWILDGSTKSSLTTATVKVPRFWVGHSLTCQVKTADEDSSVTVTSPKRAVRLALAPVASVKPTILGRVVHGHTVSCSPGNWSPTPSYFTYQWRRNGVPLPGANGYRRVVSGGDVGNLLSCVVSAHLAGHEVGRAVSPERRAW